MTTTLNQNFQMTSIGLLQNDCIEEHLTTPLFPRNYLHTLTLNFYLHDSYIECSGILQIKEKQEFFKIERERDFLNS